MRVDFCEDFELPAKEIYSYFRTPADWPRLFGSFRPTRDLGDGWHAVPLKSFPFPLVAKNTVDQPDQRVKWVFKGFWRGEGEVRFAPTAHGTRVTGYEDISARGLFWLAPLIERWFLRRAFEGVWALGWRRLRKRSGAGHSDGTPHRA